MKNLESKCLGIIDNLTLKDLFKAAEDDLSNFNIERCMGAAIVFTLTLTWPNFEVNSREVQFYFRVISGDKLRAVWRNRSIFWTSDDPLKVCRFFCVQVFGLFSVAYNMNIMKDECTL